jgi:hypothetical protein
MRLESACIAVRGRNIQVKPQKGVAVRQFFIYGLPVLLVAAVGCSKSESSSTGASGGPGKSRAQVAQVNDQSTPEHTVFEFLEAIRTGNDKHAAEMLTPMARDEAAKQDLVIAPPGSPTAKFTVGMVEYVTPEKDGAHVSSEWTDCDAQQQSKTDKFIWVLRKEPIGWRIAGLITKVIPDQPPLVLDFEDAADMIRKLKMLHGETPEEPANATPMEPAQPQAMRPAPVQSPLR